MKWISVKDKLPETPIKVIVFWRNEYNKNRISTAQFVHPKTILAEDFLSDDCDDFAEYDEKLDCYWTPSGWYEYQEATDLNFYLYENITHWMPLPEPPEK